jgi:hypothetical protein
MFVIMKFVAYVGDMEVFRADTRDDLVEWFRTRDSRDYPLDDLAIYRTDAPDVYELASEAEKLNESGNSA